MSLIDLQDFFERCFLPEKLHGQEGTYTSQYRTAIRWLEESIGRPPTLDDLSVGSITGLLDKLRAAGMGADHIRTLRKRIWSVWRFAYRLGVVDQYESLRPRAKGRRKRPGKGKPAKPVETPPADGSVWAFFEEHYRPQRMIGCAQVSIEDVRRTFRRLRDHYGRDILLEEQTDALAAEHLAWLLDSGMRAVTVNNHRATWFAVWRMAAERGLADREPKVRKLPEELDEPDAWSEEEASRIVAATDVLSDWRPICGIPADRYLRAFLLVAWWAGLRRSSLFKLRVSDVDLQTGWLHVPGTSMKNRRGRRYRLGTDAIEAIRAICTPERELLFPWEAPIDGIYNYFDELLRVAQIAPSTRRSNTKLHKWRRTVATCVAVEAGIEAASTLLNHSGAEVTRRYIDPTKLAGNDATQILPMLAAPPAAGNGNSKNTDTNEPSPSPPHERENR